MRGLLAAIVLAEAQLIAAPPTLDWLFPAGGQTNTAFTMTCGGKHEPWPVQAWSDDPAITLKPSTNEGAFKVEIGRTARLGPHLVRLHNSEGASRPRIFTVGKASEIREKEPNDGITAAHAIESLPVTINGRFDKGGDLDSYKLKLKAGSTLVAKLDSYALGSPVDPLIHLLDDKGVRIGFAHDQSTLDPLLAFTIPRSGDYYVELAAFGHPPEANVQFTGSSACVYRLTLTDGPYARFAFPAGVSKTADVPVEIAAWNAAPQKWTPAAGEVWENDKFLNTLSIQRGCFPESNEREPNDATNSAMQVSIPTVVNGRIEKAGDVDEFLILPKKGDRLVFAMNSASLGFLLDARLRLRAASGAELAQNDDSSRTHDPRIEWTAPGEGPYFLQVSDIFHKGGDDYIYRLEIRPRQPSFSLSVDKDSIALAPAASAELKVTIRRLEGFEGKIEILAEGLPEGVRIENPEIPEKGAEVTLKFAATASARPSNQPFSLRAKAGQLEEPVLFSTSANDLGGPFLIDETSSLWLTITPKK